MSTNIETLQECAQAYIEHMRVMNSASAHTLRAYTYDIERFLDWCRAEKIKPESLDTRVTRKYLAHLHACDLHRRSVHRSLSSLRGFFRYVVREGLIETSPFESIQSPRLHKELPRVFSAQQLEAILSVADVSTACGLRDQAFIELLYASGMRIGEAASLRVNSFDFKNSSVRIFGKGSKERIVPIHSFCVSTLTRYMDTARPALIADTQCTDAFFVSNKGKALSADSLRKLFRKLAIKAEIDPCLTPHDVRHSFASDLLSGGANLRSVQELLGHVSLSTTQIYTHVSPEHLRDALSKAHPRA